ncbi:MAG: hypothetical protein WBZ29_06020 [Methanocella sp.]
MDFVAEEIKVAVIGIFLVVLVAAATDVLSRLFPAKWDLYFALWALVLVPIILLIVGALAARAAYFGCMGPNRSIALSVIVSLVSAIAGTALWLLLGPATFSSDIISRYFNSLSAGGYIDLAPLLVVYALAGSIGGVYDYYISRGRPCDVRPGKGM